MSFKSEHDHPGWRVFHNVFDVILPKIFVRSVEDIQQFGAYTTGDNSYDRDLEYEDVRTVRTIAQLAQLAELGATITLVKPTDSVLIYNLIIEYARIWSREVETLGLVRDLDTYMETEEFISIEQDMSKLIAFADIIKPHATRNLPNALLPNSAMGRFKLLKSRLGNAPEAAKIDAAVLKPDAPTLLTNSGAARRIRGRLW